MSHQYRFHRVIEVCIKFNYHLLYRYCFLPGKFKFRCSIFQISDPCIGLPYRAIYTIPYIFSLETRQSRVDLQRYVVSFRSALRAPEFKSINPYIRWWQLLSIVRNSFVNVIEYRKYTTDAYRRKMQLYYRILPKDYKCIPFIGQYSFERESHAIFSRCQRYGYCL
jgi:hypothetical protein